MTSGILGLKGSPIRGELATEEMVPANGILGTAELDIGIIRGGRRVMEEVIIFSGVKG